MINKTNKLIYISLISIFFSFCITQPISAFSIPANAKKRSIIQFKNKSINVLYGEIIGDAKIDYDIKENDIITYADDTNVLQVYSKFDNKKSVPGYLFNFLYSEFNFKLNDMHLYLFESKSENETTFKNTTTDSLLIYDLKTEKLEDKNIIITKYTYLDKKFNTIYNIHSNGTNKKRIKTDGNQSTFINIDSKEGVAYEPES